MKRPLFLLLIGLVLGELCGYWLLLTGVMIPASLLCIILPAGRMVRKGEPFFDKIIRGKTQYFLLIALLLMIILGNLSWCLENTRIRITESCIHDLAGEECILEGRVTDRKTNEKGYLSLTILDPVITYEGRKYRFRGKCLCGHKVTGNGEGSQKPLPGDHIRVTAGLTCPREALNPGGFPEKTYSYANGIYGKGTLNQVLSVTRPVFSLRRYAYQLKSRMETGYRTYLNPEDSGVLCAMLLGDKSYLDRDQRKLYEENGVLHLLTVSGLHLSLLGSRFYRRLRRIGLTYTVSCLWGAVMILFYGCMTGSGMSVIRAGTMFLIYLAAEYLGRPYDLISSMSLAGILMILEHPWRILESGFQISYAALLAIGWVLPLVRSCLNMDFKTTEEEKKRNLFRKGKEGLLASLVIFMVTMPLVMRTYYECSPYSILLNPLILPAMGLVLHSALLSGITGLLYPAGPSPGILVPAQPFFLCLWRVVALPAVWILHAYRRLFAWVRSWRGALIITGCPSLPKVVLLYACELSILYLLYRKREDGNYARKVPGKICLSVLIFCIVVLFNPDSLFREAGCRITMLDVGQGESVLIRLPGRKAMLIDGGSESRQDIYEEVIRPALCYYGISGLDYLVITHMDEDHISGIRQMLQSGFRVSHLMTGSTYLRRGAAIEQVLPDSTDSPKGGGKDRDEAEQLIYRLCMKNHTSFHTMEKGDSMVIGGVHFSCLHPEKDTIYPDRNGKSLTLYVRWKDFTALFPGDLGSDREKNILQEFDRPVTLLNPLLAN